MSSVSNSSHQDKNFSIGDLAEFMFWSDKDSGENKNTKRAYVGIIIDVDRRCSEGECTYITLCEDGEIRFFITEDATRIISKL